MSFKLLFIGDIVGGPGRRALSACLPGLKAQHAPDLVVVNAENAAGGYGLTLPVLREIQHMGVQACTLGNHAWDKKELMNLIDHEETLIRPANYPPGAPGRGWCLMELGGVRVGLINLMGRAFMHGALDCPFRVAEEGVWALQQGGAQLIFVDFHAEASAEKQAMGYHLDGRVTLVVGTHTHVQTADERLLPQGTAYMTDAGMTGPLNGVIGFEATASLRRAVSGLPEKLQVEERGPVQLNGLLVEADPATGLALRVLRVAQILP